MTGNLLSFDFMSNSRYLTITDWDNIDWEQRRYEIAKECVAVLMSCEITLEDAAKISVEQADALITELKKKNKV